MRSIASPALLVAGLVLQGCIAGHLHDAGRRWEHVVAYRAAFLDGERVIVGYTAAETDDAGVLRGERERWAALDVRDLRRREAPEVETVRPTHLPGPRAGTPLPLHVGGRPVPSGAAALHVSVADGRHTALVLCEQTCGAPMSSAALTRARTLPWVYPLLPPALVVDLVGDPVLMFFAPAVMVVGD